MKISTALVSLAAIFGFSTVSSANDVIFTEVAAKRGGGSYISLDVVSNGDAAGFQFSIPLNQAGRSVEKGLDLSKCLSDLPSTHQGRCVYREKKGDILVIVFSMENSLLPEGVVGLGTISIPGGGAVAKSLKVSGVEFASPLGQRIK